MGYEPELAFDLIAEAARAAMQSDGGFVTFVGGDEVWFKAASGLVAKSLPRSQAFCDRVVKTKARVLIEDVGRDPEFSHIDYVGAYAGAPVLVQDHVVGTVCATSLAPRPFTAAQLHQLDLLARMVGERLETRREKLFLSQLFDGTSDAVLIVDEQQTIMHWNAAAETLFGYPAREALGRPLSMIIPARLRPGHDRGFARLCNGGRPTMAGAVEVPALRQDGSEFPASLSLSMWRDNERTMVGAIVRDISDREALHQARVASEAKTRFLANMSHEIRTPLNGILGLGDVLSRTALGPEQAELLRAMTGAARTLEALLSDVLDLARSEEGALRIAREPFDLPGLAREVGELHRPTAEAKGLAYAVQAPSGKHWVVGDPVRLRQVLGNLLSNAVKFTHEGSVNLQVAAVEEGWRFLVCDTGIGFDAAAKARIFDRFAQADDSITRSYGGSGLGLAISADLVRAMGGALSAASTPGAGASFTFGLTLPDAPPVLEPPASQARLDRAVRVLLAEDHPVNRKVIELILGEVGAELTSVCDGRQAVEAFGAADFDLILMDMQMPVMDGLSATREIRARQQRLGQRPCPIIMLTANVLPEHLRASFEAGADRHLGKPIEAARLLSALDEVLAARTD
ncbi:hybrid sensor histidine kinase/response regulator [Caulobacter hibisci]|uniref:hybrid sensor histidine kinase/response regulator n=1 Tax=Caulobacter hibisci TaxID=2035993 RepID=UPI0022B8230E|nr:ATP-binding protein [Caulobacter hibisci]